MSRVLITAFGPYGSWLENSSWLALVELTRNLPPAPEITTRLYPVDLAAVSERLAQDLPGQDYAIHLGQAPGATSVQLEAIGINVGAAVDRRPGPAAAAGARGTDCVPESACPWPPGPACCATRAFRLACRIMRAHISAMRRCT